MKRLRQSLSYANVIATIAVFVALGGVSYAAVNLPKNSVGPAEIEKNAVRGQEVKNRSLLCKDIKANQDVCKDPAVTVRSTVGTVPLTCTENPVPGGNFQVTCMGAANVRASCNAGERATGGGFGEPPVSQSGTSGSSNAFVTASRPDPETGSSTGWTVRAGGIGTNFGSSSPLPRPPDPQFTAFAVCKA